jgi:hypothetical protein
MYSPTLSGAVDPRVAYHASSGLTPQVNPYAPTFATGSIGVPGGSYNPPAYTPPPYAPPVQVGSPPVATFGGTVLQAGVPAQTPVVQPQMCSCPCAGMRPGG